MESRRSYDPAGTRQALVDAAFDEIMRVGYRGTSLNRIISAAEVTKGALYHHFRGGKRALSYAVLDERIRPDLEVRWFAPLKEAADPVDALQAVLRAVVAEDGASLAYSGSPVNNLAQEMSTADEGFRERMEVVYTAWREAIGEALRQGQAEGTVRENVQTDEVAVVVVALMDGAAGQTKLTRDPAVLRTCIEGLGHYLEALRPRRGFRG